MQAAGPRCGRVLGAMAGEWLMTDRPSKSRCWGLKVVVSVLTGIITIIIINVAQG